MTLKVYTGLGSGNAYKVELFLHLLSVPYEPVAISIPKGENRDPAFLKLTPDELERLDALPPAEGTRYPDSYNP